MTKDDHEQRRVGIYFGPTANTLITKDEVADFVTNQMGLIRSDGGPKWTEGLTTLIEIGIDEWEDYSPIEGPSIEEEISVLEDKIDEYHEEINDLSDTSETDTAEDVVRAADLVYQTEARILEVLCREENIGAKSPKLR